MIIDQNNTVLKEAFHFYQNKINHEFGHIKIMGKLYLIVTIVNINYDRTKNL